MAREKTSVNMDVATATCLWWSMVGVSFFVAGLILIAFSYTTIQVLTTVPSNAAVNLPSQFPELSTNVLEVGVGLATLGLVIGLWSKFSLSRLGLIKEYRSSRKDDDGE